MSETIRRHVETLVTEALEDTRAVLLVGARQAGKSTLVSSIAQRHKGSTILTLDDPNILQAALHDPVGFLERNGLTVIDEIQRVPELILPLKMRLDTERRSGQFLLTGSAQVFALKQVPDSLPGRIETIELWPLAQSEIEKVPGDIVSMLFDDKMQDIKGADDDRQGIWQRMLRGGFPEAVQRTTSRSRVRFFDNYATDTVLRNVADIVHVENPSQIVSLIEILAQYNGGLLVVDQLSQASGIPVSTLNKYLELLELSFIIKRIPAWSNSATSRATKSPKLAFIDSGIAAYFAQVPQTLEAERPECGRIVETFVLMEIARLAELFEPGMSLRHYRTRDGVEVDGVLSRRGGDSMLIEVKASSTVRAEDFRHLHHLADRMKSKFKKGIIVYFGKETLSFGKNMWALPVSALWNN